MKDCSLAPYPIMSQDSFCFNIAFLISPIEYINESARPLNN